MVIFSALLLCFELSQPCLCPSEPLGSTSIRKCRYIGLYMRIFPLLYCRSGLRCLLPHDQVEGYPRALSLRGLSLLSLRVWSCISHLRIRFFQNRIICFSWCQY